MVKSTWLTVPQEVGSYRVFTNQCKVSVPSTFALVYESGFLTFKAASPFYRRWKISKGTFQMLPNTTQHSAGWCTAGLRDLRIFDRTLFPGNHSYYGLMPSFFLEIYRQISHDFYSVDATQQGGSKWEPRKWKFWIFGSHSPPGDTYGSACSWGTRGDVKMETWRWILKNLGVLESFQNCRKSLTESFSNFYLLESFELVFGWFGDRKKTRDEHKKSCG